MLNSGNWSSDILSCFSLDKYTVRKFQGLSVNLSLSVLSLTQEKQSIRNIKDRHKVLN